LNPKDIWQATLGELQLQMTKATFDTWLKNTSLISYEDGTFIVGVHNTYAKEWLENRLLSTIKRALTSIVGRSVEVKFVVRQRASRSAKPAPLLERPVADDELSPRKGEEATYAQSWGDELSPSQEGRAAYPQRQGDSSSGDNSSDRKRPAYDELSRPRGIPSDKRRESSSYDPSLTAFNPRYTFETYIVGPGNRLAHAAAMAAAERPAEAYNPLFIYGGVGLGKTHLLHAIGYLSQRLHSSLRVIYISSERFTNDLINSIRNHTTEEFRAKYRSSDILLIDDIHFIAGKESTQEEFFHTFNALHTADKQIVISSDRPPKAISPLEERLRSRFAWGLIADIQPPDLETRIAILRSKGEAQPIPIPDEVIDLVAHKVQSNIRDLEGALNRVVAYAQTMGCPLTSDVATIALHDFIVRHHTLSPSEIIEAVARFYGLEVEDLTGPHRNKRVAVPRQVAMYLLREETDASLPQIGQELGGRDHTTVLYGWEKISAQIEADDQLRREVLAIKEMLYNVTRER